MPNAASTVRRSSEKIMCNNPQASPLLFSLVATSMSATEWDGASALVTLSSNTLISNASEIM